MEDFIMYEKYLEQLEEVGKIRNLKERSINCYKNYVSYFLKYQNKNPEELTCQDVRTYQRFPCCLFFLFLLHS